MAEEADKPMDGAPEAPVSVPENTAEPVAPIAAAVEASPAAEMPAVAETAAVAEKTAAPKRGRKPGSGKTSAKPKAPGKPVAKAAAVQAEPAPVSEAPAASPAASKVARKAVRAKRPAAPAKLAVAKPVRKAARPAPVAAPKFKIVNSNHPTTTKISEGSPTLSQSKETLMAKTSTMDFTAPIKTAIADVQSKAKTVYEKGSAAFGEASDFTKGNVEAVVESGKILASGLQELGTSMVTEGRSAFETASSEVKELAAVKTPAEFFQLQSSLVRKNFDSAVAQASKNTEAMLKLANEVMSPLSTRVTLAVEKARSAI